MENNITLQDVINIAGNYKKIGQEFVFRCPYCAGIGGDQHKDNLHFNEQKGILWCFANAEHSKMILSEIYKRKNKNKIMNEVIPQYVNNQNDYMIYQTVCNAMLLGDEKTFKIWYESGDIARIWENQQIADDFLAKIHSDEPQRAREYLEEKRGINTSTIILTGLGIDFERSKKWVIPLFDVKMQLVGFEYRGFDFDHKKVWKEKDTPATLCVIADSNRATKAIITEGILDAFCVYQLLNEKHVVNDYCIYSPTNGVASVLKSLNKLNFNRFEKILLTLDNDSAGDIATKEILKDYPFITDNRKFLVDAEVKDFGDWYLAQKVL